MTDPDWLETRRDNGDWSSPVPRRKRYMPSDQVLKELGSLGSDLGKLADELRNRLSDPTADARQ